MLVVKSKRFVISVLYLVSQHGGHSIAVRLSRYCMVANYQYNISGGSRRGELSPPPRLEAKMLTPKGPKFFFGGGGGSHLNFKENFSSPTLERSMDPPLNIEGIQSDEPFPTSCNGNILYRLIWLEHHCLILSNQILCPQSHLFLVPQAQSAKRTSFYYYFIEEVTRMIPALKIQYGVFTY